MLFKNKEEQITNSSQIKEILDKSKDISIKDEANIMSYIYDLEDKENAAFCRASQYSRQYLQAFNKLKEIKEWVYKVQQGKTSLEPIINTDKLDEVLEIIDKEEIC